MYNKLFEKILDSSIWLEADHVRLVWITFLAAMDQDGVVHLSAPGNVAQRARVTCEAAIDALRVLESPDEKSPTQEHDGRRIERIPGVGWVVLNSKKYRDIVKAAVQREHTRLRVASCRARKKDNVTKCNENVTPSDACASAVKKESGKSDAYASNGSKGKNYKHPSELIQDILSEPGQPSHTPSPEIARPAPLKPTKEGHLA